MSQNIALTAYPNHVKAIAVAVLDTLSASINWMKIPPNEKQREIMIRRWAGGIQESRLSDDGVRKAVVAYLNSRWAKDPNPEPNDVFGVSDEKLDEYNGGNNGSQMRMIRRYLTIAHNWRGHMNIPAGGITDEHGCEVFGRDMLTWQGTGMGESPPENLPELLEEMGEPELANINRNHS